MGVPLIYRDRVIGCLTLDNRLPDIYTEEHSTIAQAFASQAAIAIENARLFANAQEELLLSRTLRDVGVLLISKNELNEVLESILDLLARVVQYDSASIHLIGEDERLELAAGSGFPDFNAAREAMQRLGEHGILTKESTSQVLVLPDTSQSSAWISMPGMEYIRSWVGAPLQVKERFIGSLNVDSKTPGAFNQKTGDTVAAFANQSLDCD